VDDYVLDLRGNLGGVLDGALQIAALFLQQVLILQKTQRKMRSQKQNTRHGPEITQRKLWHIPPQKNTLA
jgi:C-terminal processing protease CtpA/Prc